MKRRLVMSVITAATALGSAGVASANSDYGRQNGLLLEVSADPRDGNDFVQVNPMRADALELIALNAPVDLRGMTVHFSDGRTFSTQMQGVTPGQPLFVDLPENCGVIQDVELDYVRPELRRSDRTPARLQIMPAADRTVTRSRWQREIGSYQQRFDRGQPASYYHRSAYMVQPQATWSGYFHGAT